MTDSIDYRQAFIDGQAIERLVLGSDGSIWRLPPRISPQLVAKIPFSRDYYDPVSVPQTSRGLEIGVGGISRTMSLTQAQQAFGETFLPPKDYPQMILKYRDDDSNNLAASNLYWGEPADTTPKMLRNMRRQAVTGVIKQAPLKNWLTVIRPPNIEYKLPEPVQSPKCTNYSVVGTAIDYLVRIELKRLRPDSISDRLIVEYPFSISRNVANPDRIFRQVEQVRRDGLTEIERYLKTANPTHDDRHRLAIVALQFTKIDANIRRGYVADDYLSYDENDVQDVMSLFQSFPFDEFSNAERVELNPKFGKGSTAIGGGDGDLLIDDRLYDLKTTIGTSFDRSDIDQIFIYSQLQAYSISRGESVQPIRSVGLVFPRQVQVRDWPLDLWTYHTRFDEFQDEFFNALDFLAQKRRSRRMRATPKDDAEPT